MGMLDMHVTSFRLMRISHRAVNLQQNLLRAVLQNCNTTIHTAHVMLRSALHYR
jgi:hypothetical protein